MNLKYEEIDDEKITIEVDGKEKECDVLFTFKSPDIDEFYVAFTDNSKDEKGSLKIYIAKSSPFTDKKFIMVEDPEELALMDGIVKDIIKNYENK